MGYIDDIDTNSPLASDDPGDFPAEMRAFKGHIKSSFPNVSGEVTCTESDFNTVDVATLGTAEASKVVTTDATKNVTGLNDVTLTGALTTTDPVLNGDLSGTAFLDEDDLSTNSATKVASQQSIKAYVDALSLGVVRQIVFASHHTNIVLNAEPTYTDVETVTLTDVQSGSNVLLFALTNVRGAATGGEYYMDLTDNSNTSVMPVSTVWRDYVTNSKYRSSPIMTNVASPGTGSVTFKLRGAEESGTASLEVESAVMVAIEYTP